MSSRKWSDNSLCLDKDTNDFFDRYENFGVGPNPDDPDNDYEYDENYRADIDSFCQLCPVQPQCLATGVSRKESGVWGGVYLDNGKISREFNSHKSKQDWFNVWQSAAMESQ